MNPNNKKILLGTGVFILVVVVAIGYIYLTQNQKGTVQTDNETIQPLEKVVNDTGIKYETVYSTLPKNSEIQFKAGGKFIYKMPEEKYVGGTNKEIKIYSIEKTEKINGRECFVVLQEDNSTSIETLFGKEDVINTIRHHTYYYDKETGKVLRVKVNDHVVEDGAKDLRATDMSFFAYWMLGLDDNAKWEIKFTETTPSLNLVQHKKLEFRVVGREKVNNRECFKVEKRTVNIDKNTVEEIDYFWVDVKKRILIKEEFYDSDKVKFYETNLVSEI